MKKDEFPLYVVLVASILVISFLIIKAPFTSSYFIGPNYANIGVNTQVNITSTMPYIKSVDIDDNSNNITLNAGMTRTIICNITVQDYNGWNDTTYVNATFWDNNNATMSDLDNATDHYTNSSCVRTGNDGLYDAYWDCGFNVWYYANNGSNWICNATAIDSYYPTNSNFSDSGYNTTTISALYALNLTTLIDYGEMAVGDTSTSSETANITNFGNFPINISVYGWGGDNVTLPEGNGLAFICQMGNISISNERYSITDQAWSSMTALSNESALVSSLTVMKRTTTEVTNTTYWRLYVPPNPFGLCNGTVVFAAEAP